METERDFLKRFGIPEGAERIYNNEGLISGVLVNDGSYDYSEEGNTFLGSVREDESSFSRAGLTPNGIFPD